ncbi:MAG: T9SS type A sorting domain-containing protein [Bacteroidota bacterium]
MSNFKNILTLLVFLAFYCSSFTQNIPANKLTDWSKAGLLDPPPVFDTVNVAANGIIGDGSTSNSLALQQLMESHDDPTVFFFPAGNYFFDQAISLSTGQVLKGASAEETVFSFDLNGENDAIEISGNVTSVRSNINADNPEALNNFSVESVGAFHADDFIRIQFDDSQLVTSSWAEKSTGQVLKILGFGGDKIVTSNLIRRAIHLSENPYVEKIDPVQFAGIECLHIERLDMTMVQTSNILLEFAANCWVKGVSSHNGNFAHVELENCAHVHVTGCHFKDAFNYGSGGQGYGVVLEFNTSDCLVDNNVFDHLRHSMLLQAGANGNVLSYNYSINPFWNEVGLPEDSAGDLVLHGNYPYLNLFEGNVVQNIVIDDSHGANGAGNMFYRNRAELYGIFMNDGVPSDGQSFIGNEITSTNFFLGFYDLAGINHFEYGNNVKGAVVPDGTQSISSNSLYLTESPAYFSAINLEIPSVGFPNNLNMGTIPAQQRIIENELTQCEIEEPVIINFVENLNTEINWHIYPNPANGYLKIDGDIIVSNYALKISAVNGAIVLIKKNATAEVDISALENGIYILTLENEKGVLNKKISIVN